METKAEKESESNAIFSTPNVHLLDTGNLTLWSEEPFKETELRAESPSLLSHRRISQVSLWDEQKVLNKM